MNNKSFLDMLVKIKKDQQKPTPPSEPYPDELLNETVCLYNLGMAMNVARDRYTKLTSEQERKELSKELKFAMLGTEILSSKVSERK